MSLTTTDLAVSVLGLGFLESHAWQAWVVATLLLLVVEVLTSGFIFLSLVPGALVAAWTAALDASWKIQVFAFSLGVLVGLIWIRPFFLQRALDAAEPTNVEALVGKRAKVLEAIPADGVGRVKVRNEEWRATAQVPIGEGEIVVVLGIEGNTLRVERSA